MNHLRLSSSSGWGWVGLRVGCKIKKKKRKFVFFPSVVCNPLLISIIQLFAFVHLFAMRTSECVNNWTSIQWRTWVGDSGLITTSLLEWVLLMISSKLSPKLVKKQKSFNQLQHKRQKNNTLQLQGQKQ